MFKLSHLLGSRRRLVETYSGERRLFDLASLERHQRGRNEAIIRGLCATVAINERMALARVLGRYKMFLDPRDFSLSAHLMLDGYWEMWLTEALAATVKPGMIVADIGANAGYFTMLLAELVGGEGHVHAFEPNSALAELIRRSARVNGFGDRITLHGDPLSDVDGLEVRLSWDEEEAGGAFIHIGDDGPQAQHVPLLTRRLDSLAALHDVDILKIDAEGSEQPIWHGAAGILASGRPLTIFLEFTACRYADPAGFVGEMVEAGFALHQVLMNDGVRRVGPAEILGWSPTEDQMLMLVRG